MEQPKLLDPVRNMIRKKHYSIRTKEAYYPQKTKRLPVVFTKDEIFILNKGGKPFRVPEI